MYKESIAGKSMRRGGVWALSVALALGLAPATAFADNLGGWADAEQEAQSAGYQPYSYAGAGASLQSVSYPTKFDLRNVTADNPVTTDDGTKVTGNFVTPVKQQNPWGTCWGFSIIAASESSLLSDVLSANASPTMKSELADGVDLSERQLAYFTYNTVPSGTGSATIESQAGEGYVTSSSDNSRLSQGGYLVYGTTMFASGRGPTYEEVAPYQNEEGSIVCKVTVNGNSTYQTLNDLQIQVKEAAGATVTKLYYASKIYGTKTGETSLYVIDSATSQEIENEDAVDATWAVDGEYWNALSFELEESSILPEMRILGSDGTYQGLNTTAVNALKDELMSGRAVSIAFYADTSQPNEQGEGKYLNENTWAHYTYEKVGLNHAVTIVGWDDDYAASNFNSGYQPPANGAWLVKNSWGAGGYSNDTFPNGGNWGIDEDGDGKGDGYFWLSYYDQTITLAETFNFDLTETSGEAYDYNIDQYDYLNSNDVLVNSSEKEIAAANVFTAENDEVMRSVSCQTVKPNSQVTYKVYLLGDSDTTPVPAGATPAFEYTATYEYGGYHRVNLADVGSEAIPMREGQRYSVVITQKCLDDGKYYSSATRAAGKLSVDDIAKLREQIKQYLEAFYRAMIEDALKADVKGKHPDWTDEQVAAEVEKQFEEIFASEAFAEVVEDYIKQYTESYYVSKVNAGESYYLAESSDSSGALVWSDWSVAVAELEAENSPMVYDNFPIKGFDTASDYASVESLAQLRDKIAAARTALTSYVISADGSDVAPGTKWVTQEAYDAMLAAIDVAQAQLDLAGEDFETKLAAATPAQGTIDDQLTALASASDTYAASAKDGLKTAQGGSQGTDTEQVLPQAAKVGSQNIPSAGDASTPLAVTGALAAVGVVCLAVARIRKMRS